MRVRSERPNSRRISSVEPDARRAAPVHYSNRGTHFRELTEDVRTDKHGGSIFCEILQGEAEVAPGEGVEAARRLVQDEDFWAV